MLYKTKKIFISHNGNLNREVIMRKTVLFTLAVLTAPMVLADDTASTESPHSFSANVAISTDYRFRGISQSARDPAVSGGFDYSYSGAPVGVFLGTWASSIDFGHADDASPDRASMEWDVYGGLNGTFPIAKGVDWKIGGLGYLYPGSDTGTGVAHYDYVEAFGSLAYDFGPFNVAAGLAYSPDYFFESGDGLYVSGDVGVPLPYDLALSGHIGHQDIHDNAQFGTPDYYDWNVGISKTWNIFTFKISYVDTNLSKSECFGGTDFCEGTGLFSVSAAYP